MPRIQIAALLALVLTALLAILSALPSTGLDGVAPAMMLAAMAFIVANIGGVLWLTRNGQGGAGLWLVLAGVAFALAFVASPLWMGLFVAPARDISEALDTIAATSRVLIVAMAVSGVLLVAGWGLWVVSWMRGRRRTA